MTEALQTKSAGTSTKLYDELLSVIRRLKVDVKPKLNRTVDGMDPTSPKQLSDLIGALSRCIAAIHERKHEVLLNEILDISIWNVPKIVRVSLLEFMTHAVVANGGLVQSCLHTLVYSLLPPPGPSAPDPNAGKEWKPDSEEEDIQDAVIATTARVLELVPTATARILPLIASNLPHRLRDRSTQCLYLRGIFTLAESNVGAGLREATLVAVIDHLISIDVEIRWEDIVEIPNEDTKEEIGGLDPKDEEPDIFELEGMTEMELALQDSAMNGKCKTDECLPGGGWEGGEHQEDIKSSECKVDQNIEGIEGNMPAVDETADKLDSMMELTLGHLNRRLAAGQLLLVWNTILAAFDRTVLHTHRSKFTQFVVFHILSLSPESCCREFLNLLLSRLMDKMQPSITRSACAAYIASFLARAAYIPEPLVIESLQKLSEWCYKYAWEEDRRGGLPPIPSSSALLSLGTQDARERHGPFFAAFQALLYVLCYHMEPLVVATEKSRKIKDQDGALCETDNGTKSELHDKLEGCANTLNKILTDTLPVLISHPVDPLSSCTRSVIVEFGRQASYLGCSNIVERLRSWEFRRRALAIQQHNPRPLEVFFPFDPYLLRRSANLLELQKNYVKWKRGHPSGAARSGMGIDKSAVIFEDGASEDMEGEGSSDDSSGLDTSSDDEDDVKKRVKDQDSDLNSSSSDSDTDDMKRTRFGSIPDSSLSSGGKRYGMRHIPEALKASLRAHSASGGSPSLGITIPGAVGSASTDAGSPWGMSPMSGYFGSNVIPMSFENRSFR